MTRPWSRHDLAFAASALAIAAVAIGARMAGLARFASDPALRVPVGSLGVAIALGLVALALAPFADRRGIER